MNILTKMSDSRPITVAKIIFKFVDDKILVPDLFMVVRIAIVSMSTNPTKTSHTPKSDNDQVTGVKKYPSIITEYIAQADFHLSWKTSPATPAPTGAPNIKSNSIGSLKYTRCPTNPPNPTEITPRTGPNNIPTIGLSMKPHESQIPP